MALLLVAVVELGPERTPLGPASRGELEAGAGLGVVGRDDAVGDGDAVVDVAEGDEDGAVGGVHGHGHVGHVQLEPHAGAGVGQGGGFHRKSD